MLNSGLGREPNGQHDPRKRAASPRKGTSYASAINVILVARLLNEHLNADFPFARGK